MEQHRCLLASSGRNGREVQNPILRKLVVSFILLFWVFGLALALLGFILSIVLLPVTLPLDVLLKALGRRGFFRRTYTSPTSYNLSYSIDHHAFRRA